MNTERFTYKGRHLREWLLQLVEGEPKRHRQASKAIVDHFFAGPRKLSGEQREAWCREFPDAVRSVLKQPGFPRGAFVQGLLRLGLEQQRIIDRKREEDGRWHLEQHRRMGKNPTPKQVVQYFGKSITRLERKEKKPTAKEFEAATDIVVCVQYVLMGLGTELLPAADELRKMLRHPSLDNDACGTIMRMGKDGLAFLPDLKEGLKKRDGLNPCAKTLGLLLRHVPEQIPACFALTRSDNKVLRCHAVIALGFCGREATKQLPRIETTARSQLKEAPDDESIGWWPVLRTSRDYEWHAWAWMLGETAVTRATVSKLLKVTKSGNKHRTAKAIECLGRIGLEAKRVVPRLIELIDEFEEFDHQEGAQARVTEALESFGPAAKVAVPALTKHIWMELKTPIGKPLHEKAPDYTVIRLLGKLGPVAKEALPALRQMKAELGRRKMRADLVEAIARIEGKP